MRCKELDIFKIFGIFLVIFEIFWDFFWEFLNFWGYFFGYNFKVPLKYSSERIIYSATNLSCLAFFMIPRALVALNYLKYENFVAKQARKGFRPLSPRSAGQYL